MSSFNSSVCLSIGVSHLQSFVMGTNPTSMFSMSVGALSHGRSPIKLLLKPFLEYLELDGCRRLALVCDAVGAQEAPYEVSLQDVQGWRLPAAVIPVGNWYAVRAALVSAVLQFIDKHTQRRWKCPRCGRARSRMAGDARGGVDEAALSNGICQVSRPSHRVSELNLASFQPIIKPCSVSIAWYACGIVGSTDP